MLAAFGVSDPDVYAPTTKTAFWSTLPLDCTWWRTGWAARRRANTPPNSPSRRCANGGRRGGRVQWQ